MSVVDDLASAVVKEMKLALEPRDRKIAELRRELDSFKARPLLKFAGTWDAARSYEPGDAAVHQGGLWICRAATSGAWDHTAWQLSVKRGRV